MHKCNGKNHGNGCTCEFGGVYYGSDGTYWNDEWQAKLPSKTWEQNDQEFCRKTKCPRCPKEVYFVRYNGGSVWFDELGNGWPKHGCFETRSTEDNEIMVLEEAARTAFQKVSALMINGARYSDIAHRSEAVQARIAAKALGQAEGRKMTEEMNKTLAENEQNPRLSTINTPAKRLILPNFAKL